MRTADPGAPRKTDDTRPEPRGPGVVSFLHSLLGTVFAVAVAALALWPHVRTLIE